MGREVRRLELKGVCNIAFATCSLAGFPFGQSEVVSLGGVMFKGTFLGEPDLNALWQWKKP